MGFFFCQSLYNYKQLLSLTIDAQQISLSVILYCLLRLLINASTFVFVFVFVFFMLSLQYLCVCVCVYFFWLMVGHFLSRIKENIFSIKPRGKRHDGNFENKLILYFPNLFIDPFKRSY